MQTRQELQNSPVSNKSPNLPNMKHVFTLLHLAWFWEMLGDIWCIFLVESAEFNYVLSFWKLRRGEVANLQILIF